MSKFIHFLYLLSLVFTFFIISYGVGSFVLFPKIPDNLKTNYANEAHNPSGEYVYTYSHVSI